MTELCRSLTTRGALLLGVSALAFAVMSVLVRLAGELGITGTESTIARFAFGLLTVGVLHFSGHNRVRLRRKWLLLARGITGGIAIFLYFLSLATAKGPEAVPLTNSVFLGNSYFVFTPLFGAWLIREQLRWSTVLSVFIALIGLYLVADPHFGNLRMGNVYGFFSGVTAAVALVWVRELRKTEEAISIFFSLCVCGLLIGLIMVPLQRPIVPSTVGWVLLVGIGITATVGQMMLTYALKYAEVGQGSIIQMSSVMYSSLAGILWLGDPVNARVIIGAVLVLGSAIYISCADRRLPPCESAS